MNRFPKIGIKPTIDGRTKGVRESLEVQTMALAQAVKNIIESNLKHYTGESFSCIIPDFTIGGQKEATDCESFFKSENVGAVITVTPCWCYGLEVSDMDKTLPRAVFGFNGTERPGAVYLAAAIAGYEQKGMPTFSIYGENVQDKDDYSIPEDVERKILTFAKSAMAVAVMKNKSYLSMGSVSMGIAGSQIDANFFYDYLSMNVEYVDMSEIKRRLELEIYDKEEFEKAIKWTRENCKQGKDLNDPKEAFSEEEKEEQFETVVKMTMIMRDLMVGNPKLAELGYSEEAIGHNAIVSGFQGQRHWTDFMPNGDFSESILNSSFDWNGKRTPYIVATENDSLNGVSMLMGYLLTNRAQMFSDVRTYWSPESVERVTGKKLTGRASDGIIHLLNSGATALDANGRQKIHGKSVFKPFYELTDEDVSSCLEATQWPVANVQYFRGGGFSCNFKTVGEMPLTMSRINIVKGLGPVLQIAEGYSVDIDEEIHSVLNDRTDPTWPTTWFVPRLTGKGAFKDVYSVMNTWGANHAAISYGHIGRDLMTLASMLRIPVSMTNVDEDHVFRPKMWSSFGTKDQEGTDFRACQTLGPLYK